MRLSCLAFVAVLVLQAPAPEREPAPQEDPRYRIRVSTELVPVPVTVKDGQGRLVPGLEVADFRIFEDGVEQRISLFTADPFPLSAAILVDTGLHTSDAQKLTSGLISLSGAFSEFDEMALYTFDTLVHQTLDFTVESDRLFAALKKLQGEAGAGTAPSGGPLWEGPRINGRSITGMPNIRRGGPAVTKRLDDAIYAAAQDLKRRDRGRRKIILVLSDGSNSSANQVSTEEALSFLQQADISVYAVEAAGVRLPGKKNTLERYTIVTGGDYYSSLRRGSIEKLYAHATEQARNQYTLAYVPRGGAGAGFHTIEVRVRRPGLTLLTREGYFSAGPTP